VSRKTYWIDMLEGIGIIILTYLVGIAIRIIIFGHFLFIGLWRRLLICSVQGHDWKFIGGGWISVPFITPSKSFECKRCLAHTDNPR